MSKVENREQIKALVADYYCNFKRTDPKFGGD